MEEEKKIVEQEKNGVGIIILNIFLAVITIALVGYIAYRNGYINLDNILNTKDEVAEEKKDTEKEEDSIKSEEVFTEYDGKYITASLPNGWSIKEFEDGKGSDMLVEGVKYKGLTGVKIYKDSTEVMMIEGVSGIGFVGCSELPIFKDTGNTYVKENEDMNKEVDMDLKTLDYKDTEYTEFKFLGKDIRRVESILYYDTQTGNSFFEAQCEKNLMTLTGLYFLDSYDYKGEAYHYVIKEGVTEDILIQLDTVLESIKVK